MIRGINSESDFLDACQMLDSYSLIQCQKFKDSFTVTYNDSSNAFDYIDDNILQQFDFI